MSPLLIIITLYCTWPGQGDHHHHQADDGLLHHHVVPTMSSIVREVMMADILQGEREVIGEELLRQTRKKW